jgi:RNA polymerase sigma-70 factor, ECF subfamily
MQPGNPPRCWRVLLPNPKGRSVGRGRRAPVNIAVASQTSPRNHAAARNRGQRSPDPVELELVAACRRGEQRAMEMLYHRYKRRVFGLVSRIAGPSEAEEVAQDVFVRIYRGLARFRGDSALSTWIYRLSVNAAITHVTRRPRMVDGEDSLAELAAPALPDRDPRLAMRLEAALAALPPGYRAILVLHDVEGLSHEECAVILGCRVGTSKSQLHKARARVRELLGPQVAAERAPQKRRKAL